MSAVLPIHLTGDKSLDHFNQWWVLNKYTLMEDADVGIREIAHAAFCAGIDFANGIEYEKHPGEWDSLNRPSKQSGVMAGSGSAVEEVKS